MMEIRASENYLNEKSLNNSRLVFCYTICRNTTTTFHARHLTVDSFMMYRYRMHPWR